MGVHGQLVAAPRSPNGITIRHHCQGTGPFARERIDEARKADVAAARGKIAASDSLDAPPALGSFAEIFADMTAAAKGHVL